MSAGCAVIVGSAFDAGEPHGLELEPIRVDTPFGLAELHRCEAYEQAWLVFRHGSPHRLLPNQINYRANAWALGELGVKSLLVTSSVGVMDPAIPLFVPLPVVDLVMLENRLPDGSACTIFWDPPPHPSANASAGQGHLVLNDGLFSTELTERVRELAKGAGVGLGPETVFTYVQGPRTKTAAENRALQAAGAQVNSMTFAPEVVLANELKISVAGVVVGHKYSTPDRDNPDEGGIEESLERSRSAMESLVVSFLRERPVVPFANHVFHFGDRE